MKNKRSSKDVSHILETLAARAQNLSSTAVYLVIGTLTCINLAFIYFAIHMGKSGGTLSGAAFIGFVIVGALYKWQATKKITVAEKKYIDNLLKTNNWQASSTDGVDHIATSLLADGHSFKIHHAFHGDYQQQAFEARVVSYITGYDKNQVVHSFLCLQFSVAQILPFIQLAAWQNKLLADADMKPSMPGTTSLQLEGKFNERYSVAIVPGTQQRVLQFMTPDFMDEVMALQYGANMEFAGPNFFAIAAFQQNRIFQFNIPTETAFSVADTCLKQMSDISRSWDAHATEAELEQCAQTAQQPRLEVFANAPDRW